MRLGPSSAGPSPAGAPPADASAAAAAALSASGGLGAGLRLPGPVPASIMIIGDSGMFDVSAALGALYHQLGTSTVVNASWPGFGLTRDPAGWHRDWPTLVADNHPQVIFAMLGGWDLGWITAHGVAAYEIVLADAAGVLGAGGARIVWLGVPPGGHAQPGLLDPIFERFAAAHPATSLYADPALALRALDGLVPRWLPGDDGRLVLARKPDGWHFCADGAVKVARLAAAAAADRGWAAEAVGGWEQGSWRIDHRFDDPKGGCDPAAAGNAPPTA